ncbi:hypothetical protein M440DRAFT_1265492 [Trichoderma longibrachiatum ATCC 18648]|uniref:Uncharacterized protein n=1 Tax=Trichoderma longibrachiatum ATCC 18648 TaxID=983965 RepID=A0A2T4C335_TRILO|nr:hypothetical protein M440DRAFT_1265492 [Trichoderma longibrachiatum ATCC 18648]
MPLVIGYVAAVSAAMCPPGSSCLAKDHIWMSFIYVQCYTPTPRKQEGKERGSPRQRRTLDHEPTLLRYSGTQQKPPAVTMSCHQKRKTSPTTNQRGRNREGGPIDIKLALARKLT